MRAAIRIGMAVILLLTMASLLPAATSRATTNADHRAQIKSMDILERPNRPGHFYGNTVRRRATR